MEFENLETELYKELENEILFNAIEEDLEKELKPKRKALNKKRRRKQTQTGSEKVVKVLKKDIKIKTILLLLITLIMNTYAWFIYISKVSLDMEVHIKSWNFELYTGDLEENFTFTVEEIYPGMPDASKEIVANNTGESSASLSCEVTSIKILDEEYRIGVDYTDDGGNTFQYTSTDLIDKLLNDYPFKIQVYVNDQIYTGDSLILTSGDTTNIELKVVWPYETTDNGKTLEENDLLDTEWGQAAYEYYNNGGNQYCIEVNVVIKAVQDNTAETP